jgi:hypothetical protein
VHRAGGRSLYFVTYLVKWQRGSRCTYRNSGALLGFAFGTHCITFAVYDEVETYSSSSPLLSVRKTFIVLVIRQCLNSSRWPVVGSVGGRKRRGNQLLRRLWLTRLPRADPVAKNGRARGMEEFGLVFSRCGVKRGAPAYPLAC